MKSFVINLDRSPQRLEHMHRLFAAMDLEFERVPAVDGQQLTPQALAAFSEKPADKHVGLTPGEVGCFLSHRQCWEKIAAGDDDFVAIFEDDIQFSALAIPFIKTDAWIPVDADIVKLEADGKRAKIKKKKIVLSHEVALARLMGRHARTGGYVISRVCARALLEKTQKITIALDELLFNPKHELFSTLTIYQILPAFCIQSELRHKSNRSGKVEPSLLSGLETERARRRKLNKNKKRSTTNSLIKLLHRPVTQSHRAFSRIYTNLLTDSIYTRIKFKNELVIAPEHEP